MDTLEATLERMTRDLTAGSLKLDMNRNTRNFPSQTDICPLCGGMEFVLVEENGIEYAKPCSCREKNIQRRRMAFAELPEMFRRKTLKDFKASVYRRPESRKAVLTASRTVKTYLDNFEVMQGRGMGLYIYSSTKGSGKTTMMAGIANELLKEHNVKFSTSMRILNEIKRTWGQEEGAESRLLDAMITCEILIVDDFGTEKSAEWINDKFYHIINERYGARRVTMYTSNCSLGQLDYDERITNRIKECAYQIAFPEESVRDYIAEGNEQELGKELMGKGERYAGK